MDCNLKKIRLLFSSFSLVSWKNHQKVIMVCSPFDSLTKSFFSLGILGVFRVQKRRLI